MQFDDREKFLPANRLGVGWLASYANDDLLTPVKAMSNPSINPLRLRRLLFRAPLPLIWNLGMRHARRFKLIRVLELIDIAQNFGDGFI